MFQLCNVYTKSDTIAKVSRHGNELEFNITSLISKRNKVELNEKTQYEIINAYCNYKGDGFKDALFTVLNDCNNAVMDTITVSSIYPLPYEIVNPILDLFDMEDLFKFLKYEFKLEPPCNLAEVFDEQIESDARGSRVQTYLKDDYLELAALVTVIKVAMLPVFNYAYIKQKDLGSINKEYTLFHLFKPHSISRSAPMLKVKGLIQKLIEQTTTSADIEAMRVLEKQIPKDELPFYILSIVMIQKVCIASLVEDDEIKNIVTKVYNYVNNKLKSTSDVSKAIRNKTTLKDVDGLPGDSESYVESHRQLFSHSPADIVEFEWAVETVDKIIYQLPPNQKQFINLEILEDSKRFTEVFNKGYITALHVSLLSIIFKSIIDPRALDYLRIEYLTKLLSVAFVYLWESGYKNLALILTSVVDTTVEDTIIINATTNKIRIPKELKDELDHFFPYRRVINEETQVNLAEESITELSDMIYEQRWIPTADKKYVEEVIGQSDYSKLVGQDLKIILANFIIQNEKNVYYTQTTKGRQVS